MRNILMTPSDIRQDYFQWLVDLVNANTVEKSYWLLMKELHEREFIFTIQRDENRALDGVDLRKRYEDYQDLEEDTMFLTYSQPCSVLEMLIALSERMALEVRQNLDSCDDINDDEIASDMFWEMICNLGLAEFDDESYVDLNGMYLVDKILTNWMDRTFEDNGEGSPFPLMYAPGDQTKEELWYQMQNYVEERYPMWDSSQL